MKIRNLLLAGLLSLEFISIFPKKNSGEITTLIYNTQNSFIGVLPGVVNKVSCREGVNGNYGIIIGMIGIFEDKFYGFSGGFITDLGENFTFKGIITSVCNNGMPGEGQGGFIKPGGRLSGLEVGLILNDNMDLDNAVQIGLINYTRETSGPYLQIGLLNISDERTTAGINFGY